MAVLRNERRITYGAFSLFIFMIVWNQMGCTILKGPLPRSVDHSITRFFPPVGKQPLGDCTCWSSAYYYNTYTQARDEGKDAASGDPDVVCSPRFLFSLISMGHYGAECTEEAMKRLSDVGCAPVSKHAMDMHWTVWPDGEARLAALRNRTGRLYRIRADSESGLQRIKTHMAAGGCAVTRGFFHANYVAYGDSAAGPGIDNGVMYTREGGLYLRHSLCICGYDDDRNYRDHRDGKVHRGAFLIANSEGQEWGAHNSTGKGTRGFLWVAYAMFSSGEFGLYADDTVEHKDPCYDNPPYPTVYFHDDREQYRPLLCGVVGIDHPERNRLSIGGGIGSVHSPVFEGPYAVEQTHAGAIAVTDSSRIVVDLTDGVPFLDRNQLLFIRICVSEAAEYPAIVTGAEFLYDPDGDGQYARYRPEDQPFTIAPGDTGFVSMTIPGHKKNGQSTIPERSEYP